MPTYLYGCGCGNAFEQFGKLDDSEADCPVCHNRARRRPFSGIPHLKGETVARYVPDPQYRAEAEKKALNRSWGDASRSAEMIRKAIVKDERGERSLDLSKME